MAYEKYDELRILIRDLRKIKKRTELFKNKPLAKEYFKWTKILKVDGRIKVQRALTEFKKYKKDALLFKSRTLKLNLKKTGYFNEVDKYTSSSKLEAVISKVIQKHDGVVYSFISEWRNIYIKYKVLALRKTVAVEMDGSTFTKFVGDLPADIYMNINGTNYNKNGLDFEFDYLNQSNDFKNLGENYIGDTTLNVMFYRY